MSVRRRIGRVAACCILLLVAAFAARRIPGVSDALKWPVHYADEHWFDEHLKDGFARLTTSEDWSAVRPLGRAQNYAWLDRAPAVVRIAHALGESGAAEPNTVAALERSRADGFALFEVDLSLAEGELRCAHDPEAVTPALPGDCRFETLLHALPRDDAWLVLDIKTDFASTGQRIIDVLAREGRAGQVIFQLYKPEDVALFDRWQAQVGLPGPIVTAYLAGRSIHDVADATRRAGIRALTLPLWRLPALAGHPAPSELQLFVHPVHDCAAWAQASAGGVRGVYTVRGLRCPGADQPSVDRTR